MKRIIFALALMFAWQTIIAQRSATEIQTDFEEEYLAVRTIVNSNEDYNVNTLANNLAILLIELERVNEFGKDVLPVTRELVSTKSDPYILVLVEKSLNENNSLPISLHMKNKLLKTVSRQINLLCENAYPYYSYPTKEKKPVKFISIRSGNDMFTMAGLYDLLFYPKGKYMKDRGVFFQRNDDRDYTGSLLIEIGTDFFAFLRKRATKSYQTLLYGFDVYTPYFKDSTIFSADTSFNTKDRPHASFQYVGWSKKGLSRNGKYKWASTIKFGKIGGKAGAKFQNALHQDISYSPRPKGWDAQIANGGRIGLSFEFKEEFFPIRISSFKLPPYSFKRLYASFFAEEKIGTYMTSVSLGAQISNKNFSEMNHNFIHHRTRQTVNNMFDHLFYNIAFSTNYIQHNTMLEGYGILNSREDTTDILTPISRYYLKRDQVRRITFLLNTTVSYTTRFATFFYNWKSFSPETKLADIGINSPYSGKKMNISKRWHHFAEIGFTVNIH